MRYTEKITELRAVIRDKIAPLIDNDYLLLDLPFHNNIGDILIWKGEEDFLKSIPYTCIERGSKVWRGNSYEIEDKIILLHGGGNFGDLYRAHQDFRLKIIQRYHKNKIIIFPQSVWYADESKAISDANICSHHANLTICARDMWSYNYLTKYFYKNKILLVPDMAFYINDEFLMPFRDISFGSRGLFFRRIDKEVTESTPSEINDYDVRDWPTIENPGNKEFDRISRICKFVPMSIFKFLNGSLVRHARSKLLETLPSIGLNLLDPYSIVVTTRLHALILSFLMGKQVYYIDNSTKKLSAFCETWLQDMSNVKPFVEHHNEN